MVSFIHSFIQNIYFDTCSYTFYKQSINNFCIKYILVRLQLYKLVIYNLHFQFIFLLQSVSGVLVKLRIHGYDALHYQIRFEMWRSLESFNFNKGNVAVHLGKALGWGKLMDLDIDLAVKDRDLLQVP